MNRSVRGRRGILFVLFWSWVGTLVLLIPVQSTAQDPPPLRILSVDERAPDRGQSEAVNRILAIVDDEAITMQEYKNSFGDTVLREDQLQTLIDEYLIREAAKDAGILLQKERIKQFVDQQIRGMKAEMGPRGFQQFLTQSGRTEQEYRRALLFRLRDQILQARVAVRFFPQLALPDTQVARQQVRARLMLLPDSATAHQVFGTLQESPTMTTWNQLFERHSRKVGFMGEHGDLDWFHWGDFNPDIEYQIFKRDPYRVSRPFRVGDYFGIVLPMGQRQAADNVPSQSLEVYETFRQRLYLERVTDQLRNQYTVLIPDSVREELNKGA